MGTLVGDVPRVALCVGAMPVGAVVAGIEAAVVALAAPIETGFTRLGGTFLLPPNGDGLLVVLVVALLLPAVKLPNKKEINGLVEGMCAENVR